MSVAMVLTVVILQIAVSSTLVLNQSTHLGNKRVQLMSKADDCLRKLQFELSRSSSDTDPLTNQPYMTVTGDEGAREVQFRRVVEYAEKSGEVIPVWSSEITFRLDGDQVLRDQNGQSQILLRGVAALDFEILTSGAVHAEVTVFDLTPGSAAQAVGRSMTIRPGF